MSQMSAMSASEGEYWEHVARCLLTRHLPAEGQAGTIAGCDDGDTSGSGRVIFGWDRSTGADTVAPGR